MIKIVADSTCDLSEELIKKYDISVIPLNILLGEEEYLDGVNITPQKIFDWSEKNKTTPKTSAVFMELAVNTLKTYVEAGDEYRGSYSDSYEYAEDILYRLGVKGVNDFSGLCWDIGCVRGIKRRGKLLNGLAL